MPDAAHRNYYGNFQGVFRHPGTDVRAGGANVRCGSGSAKRPGMDNLIPSVQVNVLFWAISSYSLPFY
jgi:hypothetical protein